MRNVDLEARQKIERKVVSKLIDEALIAGYTISVNNGEEVVIKNSTDKKAILNEMFSVDEEHLIMHKEDNKSFVFLVYGNDGYDVICDYSVSLEHIMPNVNKVIDKLQVKK